MALLSRTAAMMEEGSLRSARILWKLPDASTVVRRFGMGFVVSRIARKTFAPRVEACMAAEEATLPVGPKIMMFLVAILDVIFSFVL